MMPTWSKFINRSALYTGAGVATLHTIASAPLFMQLPIDQTVPTVTPDQTLACPRCGNAISCRIESVQEIPGAMLVTVQFGNE